MPHNLFQTLLSRATTPLLDADSMDQPSVDRSPMKARLDGFVAGTLEDMSTPLNLAATVIPFGRIGKLAGKALPAIAKSSGILERMAKETAEGGVQQWMKPKLASRWELGRQPKPGGALHEVLERAATKSGMGDTPTSGEAQLMKQFMKYPRGR